MTRTRPLLGLLGLLLASPALLAQASGDTCATALVVVDGGTSWSTTQATASGVHPGCGGADDPIDLWFQYTAICDGTVQVDTLGTPSGDTRLSVWDASLGCPSPGAVPLDCDDDGAGGLLSSATIPVFTGGVYYIQAAGYSGSVLASAQLNVTCIPSIAGDTCLNALPMAIDSSVPFDTAGAANEGVAASCMYTAGTGSVTDLWFSVLPGNDGMLRASTCGAGGDTQIGVYLADCMTEIGCSDDECFATSEVDFNAMAGETYLIQVSGWGPTATVSSTLTVSVLASLPPVNDDCFSAVALGNSAFFSTQAAVQSPLSSSCGGGPDVWYYFIAPCAGDYRFETCGSSFDTVLSAWMDNCPSPSTPAFTCNDNAIDGGCVGTSQSSVTVPLAEGGVAYLQVTGAVGATGTGTLTVTSTSAPSNDMCDQALLVSEGTTLWTTECTTQSGVDPACGGFGAPFDVWFEYTASCTGSVHVTTEGTPTGNTRIALYDASLGCPVPGEVPLVCDDSTPGNFSSIIWPVTAGQTYFIQAAGVSHATIPAGALLHIECLLPLSNDTCATAAPIVPGVMVPFDTTAASNEGTHPSCLHGTGGVIDVWFEFTATTGGLYQASTCTGGVNTQMGVYESDCSTEVACTESGCGVAAEVEFSAVAGETYKVQVSGWGATSTVASELIVVNLAPPIVTFVRGDCNQDGGFDIADAVITLGLLFGGQAPPPCDDACDSNDDGSLNIADAVATLNALFGGTAQPSAPFPDCGVDPGTDALDCASHAPCP